MKRMLALPLWLMLCVAHVAAAEDIAAELHLQNMKQPQPHRVASGVIDAKDLGRMRAAGIKHVINLRTAEESKGFDEQAIATGLGLGYHAIPMQGAQSLTRENAAKLDELLKQIGDEPVLVHCASGNRVGALISLREAWINGKSAEAAIAEGKRWGLTSMEGAVRSALTNP